MSKHSNLGHHASIWFKSPLIYNKFFFISQISFTLLLYLHTRNILEQSFFAIYRYINTHLVKDQWKLFKIFFFLLKCFGQFWGVSGIYLKTNVQCEYFQKPLSRFVFCMKIGSPNTNILWKIKEQVKLEKKKKINYTEQVEILLCFTCSFIWYTRDFFLSKF